MEGLLGHYVRIVQPDCRHLIEQYRVMDVAHKVVGVGSVGTKAWIVLLVGALTPAGIATMDSVSSKAAPDPGIRSPPPRLAYHEGRAGVSGLLRPPAAGLEGCSGGRRP